MSSIRLYLLPDTIFEYCKPFLPPTIANPSCNNQFVHQGIPKKQQKLSMFFRRFLGFHLIISRVQIDYSNLKISQTCGEFPQVSPDIRTIAVLQKLATVEQKNFYFLGFFRLSSSGQTSLQNQLF